MVDASESTYLRAPQVVDALKARIAQMENHEGVRDAELAATAEALMRSQRQVAALQDEQERLRAQANGGARPIDADKEAKKVRQDGRRRTCERRAADSYPQATEMHEHHHFVRPGRAEVSGAGGACETVLMAVLFLVMVSLGLTLLGHVLMTRLHVSAQAEAAAKRSALRLKEAAERVADLDARAGIAARHACNQPCCLQDTQVSTSRLSLGLDKLIEVPVGCRRISILESELEQSQEAQRELQAQAAAAQQAAAREREALQARLSSLAITLFAQEQHTPGRPGVVSTQSDAGIVLFICPGNAKSDRSHEMSVVAMQRKCAKLEASLAASQRQARQADQEVQEMEKAFRILQQEAPPFRSHYLPLIAARLLLLNVTFAVTTGKKAPAHE